MKKTLGIIKNIVNVFLVIFVVLFLLMVCLQRFTNNEISFFNYRMFTVATGSMAPEYNVGDVLIARETPPEKIKVGDSLTYLGKQGTFAGKVVTHSVTRIKKDQNGKYVFHTKGIANLVEDPPVYEDQVYGVIVWNPKILSFIYKIINTKYGLFVFVVLPIFYIVGSEMLNAMLEREEERRAKMRENKEQKKEEEKIEKEVIKPIEKEEIKDEVIEEVVDEKPEKEKKTSTKKTTTAKKTTKSTATKKATSKEETKTTKKSTTKKTTPKKETKK